MNTTLYQGIEAYSLLATAIIKMAVYDYEQSVKTHSISSQKSIEYFFKSQWCEGLLCMASESIVDISGKDLIDMVNKKNKNNQGGAAHGKSQQRSINRKNDNKT